MTFTSLGKVVSVTPGTPVALAASYKPVNQITFNQAPGQTGNVYVGLVGMNKTTGAGVIYAFIPTGASGYADTKTINGAGSDDGVDLSQFVIDADTTAMGLFVSYQVE